MLRTGLKDLELAGFKVTTSVFCFGSECPAGSISDSILATKSVKDQKFNQVNVKDLTALLINRFMSGATSHLGSRGELQRATGKEKEQKNGNQ